MWSRTILLAAIPCVLCRRNVTVDDQAFTYDPIESWKPSASSPLDVGGIHMLTQDPTATATFQFKGVAVYYMSPLWPYDVFTFVSLDSGPKFLLDLVDHSRPDAVQGPETVQSHVIWGSGELSNTQHTLVISVETYGIVDALIYTVLDSDPSDTKPTTTSSTTSTSSSTQAQSSSSLSSSSSSAAATATTSASADASKSTNALPIALGTVFGVLALLLILLGVWFIRRKRRSASGALTASRSLYPVYPPVAAASVPLIGSEHASADMDQYYDNSWEGDATSGLIPGAMAPAVAAAYAKPYGNASSITDEPSNDGWQSTTTKIEQGKRYQSSASTTITETSPQGSSNSSGSYTGDLSADSAGVVDATPKNREPLSPGFESNGPPPYSP